MKEEEEGTFKTYPKESGITEQEAGACCQVQFDSTPDCFSVRDRGCVSVCPHIYDCVLFLLNSTWRQEIHDI